MKLVQKLDSIFYPGSNDNWDDEIFRAAILNRLKGYSEPVLLDVGAGAGIVKQMNFRSIATKVVGIDPDPRVTENPFLDEGIQGIGDKLPLPNSTFDCVIADNVLEHLPNPAAVFSEVHRVLRPGGVFLAKTPNRYHYMPLISSLTPTRFHRWYNKRRGRATADTFPTLYRANSKSQIEFLARQAGFEIVAIKRIEGRPEYLRFSTVPYIAGILYERLVNALPLFSALRVVLVLELRKSR